MSESGKARRIFESAGPGAARMTGRAEVPATLNPSPPGDPHSENSTAHYGLNFP
jgi:hypothetical protein